MQESLRKARGLRRAACAPQELGARNCGKKFALVVLLSVREEHLRNNAVGGQTACTTLCERTLSASSFAQRRKQWRLPEVDTWSACSGRGMKTALSLVCLWLCTHEYTHTRALSVLPIRRSGS